MRKGLGSRGSPCDVSPGNLIDAAASNGAMGNVLLPAVRCASLLAALASIGLWARSYFVTDHFIWRVRSATAGFELIDSRAVQTVPGRLVFQERTALM